MSGTGSNDRLPHFVDRAPFAPDAEVALTPAQERFYMASQWRLMWWKLSRHRIAVAAGIFLLALYVIAAIAEFVAPYELQHRDRRFIYAPPQSIQLFHEGRFVGPFVYGMRMQRDSETLQPHYIHDPARIQELRFFCSGGYRGGGYEFWGGLFTGDFHLVCPARGGTLFLLGTDRLGRDMFSRIVYGARVSMTIGLIGIVLSFVLGIVIG
ncbi:MAG: ABC transporter permease, partial [Alphaproteobacteria bacterium]|nr:ABC transporter permease [Alphaproteobacteria bacterium]